MSIVMDTLSTSAALGQAVRELRLQNGLKASDIAARAGRSRDILYRLERGQDLTVSAMLDILRAMGQTLALVPARMPTLEEMRKQFGSEE